MIVDDGGYSRRQYDPALLRLTAGKIAAALPEMMKRLNADTVVVTGKSGISLAFATQMLLEFPLVVVRKPNESSHGSDIEGNNGHTIGRYIILDDFVASGATVRRIVERLDLAACRRGTGSNVQPVGVLCYDEGTPRESVDSGRGDLTVQMV